MGKTRKQDQGRSVRKRHTKSGRTHESYAVTKRPRSGAKHAPPADTLRCTSKRCVPIMEKKTADRGVLSGRTKKTEVVQKSSLLLEFVSPVDKRRSSSVTTRSKTTQRETPSYWSHECDAVTKPAKMIAETGPSEDKEKQKTTSSSATTKGKKAQRYDRFDHGSQFVMYGAGPPKPLPLPLMDKKRKVIYEWNQSSLRGEKYIRRLIQKCLPPADILDELCDLYGRKSKIVREICEAVIVQTKKQIETLTKCTDIVADIYPSFTLEKGNHIVFVITLKKIIDVTLLEEDILFATEFRVLGCYSTEAKSIYQSKTVEHMSMRDQLKVKRCINIHSEELLKRHRYLSIITASTQKSRGFKTDNHYKDRRLCIVFFVHAKGFIPIDEDPFDETYDKIAIDVLEGVFTPYMKTCTEYHDNVKMGCKIFRSNIRGGTLWGFYDHHKHGLIGLTCAHALLNSKELERFEKHGSN
ncbi:uncharacterized protein LOC128219304 [Mya arenaria]|uniref:uncharacterized protein LOC128219304 n=1 Tax=Mya arenaria TaxID=6604 RepID=UPI0022DEFC9B|nr:uncharacterized protein LOC128219304 [Mya arenaria]